jgi:ferric-dicitrate binding protein FerR (iron transport regulator)
MNTTIHRLSELSFKYLKEELSEEESVELNEFLNQSDANREFFDELTNQARINEDLEEYYKTDHNVVWDTVVKANPELQRGTLISFFRPTIKYAAAVILIAALGTYWVLRRTTNKTVALTETKEQISKGVEPGQYKAKLTLDDGSTIILDSAKDGKLVQQGGLIVLNKDGKLTYEKVGETDKVLYNTLTTANGQMYATVLSDGTKVWLNSQSSIRYPVYFNENERTVQITGEVYFNVAHNAEMPFHVLISGIDMQVLGTEFNVNGYNDESEIRTTLLKGRLKVSKGNLVKVLSPGQQTKYNKETQQLDKLESVDVNEVVAWKNGYFQFNDADWQTVFRQIRRWYEIDVEFRGPIPQRKISGKIPRNSSLSEVLEALETLESFKTNQVHFTLEGKKIIVMP